MTSSLYVGTIRHRRHGRPAHSFRYRIAMACLDLSELDRIFAGRLLWSTSRPAPFRFHRDDHLGHSRRPLDEAVRDLVARHTGTRPAGPVHLLTSLRVFGYVFNPVSLYFCHGRGRQRPEALVAEVSNTPWGERHAYVLPWPAGHRVLTARHPKTFHVSPFMPMDMEYRWRVTAPGAGLTVHLENLRQGATVHDATMVLRRRPLSTASLVATTLAYPLMPFRTLAGIYGQALRLWWKGARFHPHPGAAPGRAGMEPR